MVGEIRKQQAKCLPQKESPTSTVFLTGSFLARIRSSEASTMVICIAPSSFFSTITAPLAPKGNDDGIIRDAFSKKWHVTFLNSVSKNGLAGSSRLCIPQEQVRAMEWRTRNHSHRCNYNHQSSIKREEFLRLFLTHILFLRSHHTSVVRIERVGNEYDRTTTTSSPPVINNGIVII